MARGGAARAKQQAVSVDARASENFARVGRGVEACRVAAAARAGAGAARYGAHRVARSREQYVSS